MSSYALTKSSSTIAKPTQSYKSHLQQSRGSSYHAVPYAKPKPCYARATMSIPRSIPPSPLSFPSSDPAPRRNHRARTPPTKHVLGRRARGNSTLNAHRSALKKSRFPNCSDSSPDSPDLQHRVQASAGVSSSIHTAHFPILHNRLSDLHPAAI